MIGAFNRRWLAIAAATTCTLGVLCGPTAFAAAKVDKAVAALEIAPADGGSEIKGGDTAARPSTPALPSVHAPTAPLGQGYASEVEPNGTFATASPLGGTNLVARGNLFPNGDIDFYSFTANAGDKVYAAIMTSGSAGSSTDSQLTLLASDGTTVIEFDDDNGSFAALSSTIAGATIPTNGTYFLKVNDFTAGTTSERAYELHLRVQSGTPTPEVEANDTPATANVLPANGWVSGTRNPAAAAERDFYSFAANAGDTVYLSLDVDPERDGTSWNGRLGLALFGDASDQILVVDDAGTGDVTPNPNIPSEALFITVKNAGTYFAFVDSASAAVGGPTATYNLSVSVHPAANEGVNCTTYTSTDVPQTIGPGTGLVSSTITVPGNPRIADVDVSIVLNHAVMNEIDAHLRSPAGNDNGLFTDIGAAAAGGQAQMDTTFDDEAGTPPSFTVLKGLQIKPENNSTAGTASTSGAYRLAAYDGENAGGVWTLDLRDDTANANGGTLTSWSLRICEAPPPPACAPGFVAQTVYSTDFEAGAAGFTHTGTQDEWALGLPATVATTTANPIAGFSTCNSGVNCWKTDLTGTYNASSNQDLVSPSINLAGLSPPVVVTWAQRHQVETANFDHMYVDFRQVGGATPVRLYEWLDPTPISASAGTGNPQVNIGGSYGWGVQSRRADSLAGLNSELAFHLDSDTTVQFGGLAVDDVSVTACRALVADLAITKTDGVVSAVPGTSTTYTITASNAGPDPVTGATVADTFPAACVSPTWTCVGAGGGTCAASGSGNINDATVNLPSGGSVTYTATCPISPATIGILSNTATVSSSVSDPNPANNSATDSDNLTPQANLGITKTDGVATVTAGASTTYTITASNAGPSAAPGSTVADTFPASCVSPTWTCAGAGGGTCTAAGSGNINDTANLPAGGSVTYTATCPVNGAASGTLVNTATVAAAGGVTDPTPGNNSATDTDNILSAQADLSITKTDGVTTAVPGASVTYTITASNAGPGAATGATVNDTFPASCSSVAWTCAGAGGGTCTANGSGNIADTVNLPVAGSATYTAVCTIPAAASGTLANTATVATPAGVTDPNSANNSATDTDTLVGQTDLSITLTDAPDPVSAGANLTYTATVTNAGPSDASGVTITLPLPAGTSLVSGSVAGGGSCVGSPVVCTVTGNMTPASSRVATIVLAVAPAVVNGTVLAATATAAAATTDPNNANNSATTTTAVIASADLLLGLTSSATQAVVNVPVTFTATSLNQGPSDAQDVSITLTLTPDFRYTSHTATGATCTTPQVGTTGAVVCTWAGATAPGVTRTLAVVAYSNSEGSTAVNASTSSPTADPVANNNLGNLAVVVGFLTQEIPALSGLGLLLLSLLLGVAGFVTMRRQS